MRAGTRTGGRYDLPHAGLWHSRRRATNTSEQRAAMAPRQIDGRCDVTPPSFETDIKPMFRERDRQSMQRAFDLWSYDDVSQHADAILNRLQAGTMPCDGSWPPAQVDLFQRWAESGKPQ